MPKYLVSVRACGYKMKTFGDIALLFEKEKNFGENILCV